MLDEFRNAIDGCGDARYATGHGFHQNDRDAFGQAGQHKHIGRRELLTYLRLGQRARQCDVALQPEGMHGLLDTTQIGPGAHHGQVEIRAQIAQPPTGLYQKHLAFCGSQAADAQQACRPGMRVAQRVCKKAGVNAEAANLQFAPLPRFADAHQLSADVSADADNIVRLLDLGTQVLTRDVIELVRAVDRVGEMATGQTLDEHADGCASIAEVHVEE